MSPGRPSCGWAECSCRWWVPDRSGSTTCRCGKRPAARNCGGKRRSIAWYAVSTIPSTAPCWTTWWKPRVPNASICSCACLRAMPTCKTCAIRRARRMTGRSRTLRTCSAMPLPAGATRPAWRPGSTSTNWIPACRSSGSTRNWPRTWIVSTRITTCVPPAPGTRRRVTARTRIWMWPGCTSICGRAATGNTTMKWRRPWAAPTGCASRPRTNRLWSTSSEWPTATGG